MRLTKQVEDARTLLEDSIERMEDQQKKIAELPDDTPKEEREFAASLFEKYEEEVTRRRENMERMIAVDNARTSIPSLDDDDPATDDTEPSKRITVKEPPVYRADNNDKVSFFADIFQSSRGDVRATERLNRHQLEQRDVSTADPGAGVFLPPRLSRRDVGGTAP